MRLLVLDHFFSHDIAALQLACGAETSIKTLDSAYLRQAALRILPASAASGLESMADPRYERERKRWAHALNSILRSEYRAWPFDALVAPSDTFFYVRDAPEACHQLGVPFVVIQKETTISDSTMNEHSKAVRRWAPPLADWMTCCSKRNREFWERCGYDAERVDVTGQPRFDYYRHPELWPQRKDSQPTALFFSYELSAYHPSGATGEHGAEAWGPLHRQTEDRLWQLARRGWKIKIKPHPQQLCGEEHRRMETAVRDLPKGSVEFVAARADARELIVTSDVVVGFQTTALIEALTLGRPVVYTGWDPEAHRLCEELIPFPSWEGPVVVVSDPDDFVSAVEGARGACMSQTEAQAADRIVDEYLGPIDGDASRRALESTSAFIERYSESVCPAALARRSSLLSEPSWKHTSLRRGRRRLIERIAKAVPSLRR